MTPDQAMRAAVLLDTLAPRASKDYPAALAAVAFLQRYAMHPNRCGWIYQAGSVHAFDPALGRDVILQRMSCLAESLPLAWQSPGELVVLTTGNRATVKAQRFALAKRLEQRGMAVLAQAVRDVKLRQLGDQVLGMYDPIGTPIELSLPLRYP